MAGVLAQDNPDLLKDNDLKAADFRGIAKAIINLYTPGKSNSKLRKRSRDVVDAAWDHSSEVVHSPNKNIPDAKICLLLTCTAVSLTQNLFWKYLGFDNEPKCPVCKSMDFELISEEDSEELIFSCNKCSHKEVIAKQT